MRPLLTMRQALASPLYFGEVLKGDSWASWRVLLIAIMGEALTDDERQTFRELTGRDVEPGALVDEFWGICGRRAGKTQAMAVLASYIGGCCDHRAVLAHGQRGKLPLMAATKDQAARGVQLHSRRIRSGAEPAPAARG